MRHNCEKYMRESGISSEPGQTCDDILGEGADDVMYLADPNWEENGLDKKWCGRCAKVVTLPHISPINCNGNMTFSEKIKTLAVDKTSLKASDRD